MPLDHMVSTCARSYFTHANGDLMHGPDHPDRSNDDDPPNLYVVQETGIARAESKYHVRVFGARTSVA